MSALETKLRKTLKQHGFTVAAEEIELNRTSNFHVKRNLAMWDNYPACMNIYPTHLLVKRTYDE
jgi:hypothetical protein